jgi:hypothetical protein
VAILSGSDTGGIAAEHQACLLVRDQQVIPHGHRARDDPRVLRAHFEAEVALGDEIVLHHDGAAAVHVDAAGEAAPVARSRPHHLVAAHDAVARDEVLVGLNVSLAADQIDGDVVHVAHDVVCHLEAVDVAVEGERLARRRVAVEDLVAVDHQVGDRGRLRAVHRDAHRIATTDVVDAVLPQLDVRSGTRDPDAGPVIEAQVVAKLETDHPHPAPASDQEEIVARNARPIDDRVLTGPHLERDVRAGRAAPREDELLDVRCRLLVHAPCRQA